MQELDTIATQTLQQVLGERIQDQKWLHLLKTLEPTGAADMLQIQAALRLERDKTRTILDQIMACGAALPPIFESLEVYAARAGVRGRSPRIYRLGESGAALLRQNGFKSAAACRLSSERELTHAVLMLDVRLAALKAGLEVVTDRNLKYGPSQNIRPDNLIQLADGAWAIFEVEQDVKADTLRRVNLSVQHKVAFFKSPDRPEISRHVRMLVNVTRGQEMERVVQAWQQICQIVAQDNELPFQLWLMPLSEFLIIPDWGAAPDPQRWVKIASGSQPTRQAAAPAGKQAALSRSPALPVFRHTTHEDRLVLQAMSIFLDEMARKQPGKYPLPNPEFFEIAKLIYLPSHDSNAPLFDQAAIPWRSLILEKHYLKLHPQLKEKLSKTAVHGGATMRWNPTTMLHRMQVMIDKFLAYHGWRNNGPLKVWAGITDTHRDDTNVFGVVVQIRNREILMLPGQTILPSQEEVDTAQKALAFMLFAIFAYADELDLAGTGFW